MFRVKQIFKTKVTGRRGVGVLSICGKIRTCRTSVSRHSDMYCSGISVPDVRRNQIKRVYYSFTRCK